MVQGELGPCGLGEGGTASSPGPWMVSAQFAGNLAPPDGGLGSQGQPAESQRLGQGRAGVSGCRASGRRWAWVLAGQRLDRQRQQVLVRRALCASSQRAFGGKAPGKKAGALSLRGARTLSAGELQVSWAPLQEMVIKDAEMHPGPVSPFLVSLWVHKNTSNGEMESQHVDGAETAGQGSCGNHPPPRPSWGGRGEGALCSLSPRGRAAPRGHSSPH